ncbi:M50 family metallopeptidase [Jiangella sp. DSM 45060]|uniref:M50 family metallopeptidase n=1 Tax=Jiangella sp. DSM 45060 TaxID=1798224 RepID=UPI00087BDCA1|nr:M50 family metallopeptidase [Jiangella sp. DSM 45060]SDS10340.1 Peptidase M50B-like [Jiangella sp. DSM 45060]
MSPAERTRVEVRRAVYLQLAAVVAVAALLARDDGVATALARGAAAGVVALVTCVAHEAGHALAARARGLRVHTVVLRGLLDAGTVRSVSPGRRTEALVCLAGPAASVLLALAGLAVVAGTPDHWRLGRLLLVLNAFVALAALTAGPRSDGARALRAWRTTGPDRVRAP